jgi:hypothetical protein
MDDIKNCPVCGQSRPFPTQPGIWEFREHSHLPWTRCRVVLSTGKEHHDAPEGVLILFIKGNKEPCWWPTAEWRKWEGN